MIKIGFIISRKENECRRAITLDDLKKVKNKEYIMLEEGYFEPFQITDDDVRAEGFKVTSYREILNECECIVDPKVGDSEDLASFTNKIINKVILAIATTEPRFVNIFTMVVNHSCLTL